MPKLDGLKVVRSSIHGYGVIAERAFTEGETIVFADGIVYREDEEFDDEYCLILVGTETDDEPPLYFDLTDQTRWINHSCDPNTEVDTDWDPETQTASAWWIALRDIEKGEELTYDYAFAAHLAIPCNCGTARCRGLIVDEDEAHEVPRKLRHLLRGPLAEPKSRRA
jgi:SET domain-containing protein